MCFGDKIHFRKQSTIVLLLFHDVSCLSYFSCCFLMFSRNRWFDQVYNIQEKMMVQLQPLEAMERLEASHQPPIRLVDEAY